MMAEKLFVSQKGLIIDDGKVLVLKESSKDPYNTCIGKWCLPGGRVDPGETLDEGFHRKMMEEIGIQVTKGKLLCTSEARPKPRGEERHIVLLHWLCTSDTKDIVMSDEHDEYAWIDPKEYKNYPIPDGELPAFEALIEFLNKKSQD